MPKIDEMKNSKPIKEKCRLILEGYKKESKGFLSAPGEEGIKRSTAFIALLTGIGDDHKPMDVFLSLCQFYRNHYSKGSRLIIGLEYYLADLAGQKIPNLIIGPHGGNSYAVLAARDEFGKYVNRLLKEEFMDNEDSLLRTKLG